MVKRSKAEWLRLIKEHKSSGLSAAEFCRRNNLDSKYFSLRRRELTKPETAFVEVAPPQRTPTVVTVRVIELTVPLTDLKSVLTSLS